MLEKLKAFFGEDKSPVRVVIEGFSVITALGFVISAALNAVIFMMWGLNFFAIASASDAINFGIFVSLIIAIAIGTIAAVGWLLGDQFPIVYRIFANLLGMLAMMTVLKDIFPPVERIQQLLFTSALWSALMVYFAIQLLSVWVHRSYRQGLTTPLVLFYIVLTLTIFAAIAIQVNYRGYTGMLQYQVVGSDKSCPVLWTGERAVILRCGSAIVILYGPENATMRGATTPS